MRSVYSYLKNSYLIKMILIWLILILYLFLSACIQISPNLDQEASTKTVPTFVPQTQQVVQDHRKDRIIVFVSDRRERDNLDLWAIDIETGELEALTSDESQDWGPIWSPDGEKLAYLSAKNQEDVYIIVLDFQSGKTINQLYKPDVWNMSWASDSDGLWLDTYSGIWYYDIIEENTTKRIENNYGGSIDESYDSKFIAIGTPKIENSHLYELQILNEEYIDIPIQYRDSLLDLSINGLAWANTTNRLITTFQTANNYVKGKISILNFSETYFDEVSTESGRDVSLDYCHPAWSPTDEHLSYVTAWRYEEIPCMGDVYIAEDDLDQTFHISDNATITGQPWSPTGTQIVYSKNAKSPWWAPSRSFGFSGAGSLWVANYDGSEKRMLTDSEGYDGEAVWRP